MLDNLLFIIVPFAAYLITQATKLALDGIKGNLDIYHMWHMYGGMPSAHSAFVGSLTTYIGLVEGVSSTPFAIAFIFGALAIRDAMGFRRMLGKHANYINDLIAKLPAKERTSHPTLIEKIGHSPLEVSVGLIFGITVALLAFYFI